MIIYAYACDEHGEFEVVKPMAEYERKEVCPICMKEAQRVFYPIADVWHCDGAHKTDYTKHGSKLDLLNKKWSRAAGGEKPPPPAADTPKNSKDVY